jgi:two-component system, NarL family, sensor histidine kinase LiaS
MRHAQSIQWFQQLRWKLSLLYTLVTVTLIFIGLGVREAHGYYTYRSLYQPEAIAQALAVNAWQVAPYISTTPVNTGEVTLWLKNKIRQIKGEDGRPPIGLSFYSAPSVEIVVADSGGVALVSQSETATASSSRIEGQLPPSQTSLINAALNGETDVKRLSARESDGALIAAAPIFDGERQVVGALLIRIYAPIDWGAHWSRFASGLTHPLLTMIIMASIGGIGFGLITTHYLVAPLKIINTAADAWSRGEFSTIAGDSATDELGQLARRLNLMAKDLQGLIALRQELATMEERNRLARDLHDTVKQQVFAMAMQIGAAQRMLDGANGASPEIKKRLTEAEKLARQAQYELVAIINELQPMDRAGKDFEQVLRESVEDWSRQSGVAAEVNCKRLSAAPRSVQQTFFRIVQEALANVARHSHATHAVIHVSVDQEDAILSITDDGAGFDPGKTSGGMGLQNMRERAEALPGGWFELEVAEAKGVRVAAGCQINTVKKG